MVQLRIRRFYQLEISTSLKGQKTMIYTKGFLIQEEYITLYAYKNTNKDSDKEVSISYSNSSPKPSYLLPRLTCDDIPPPPNYYYNLYNYLLRLQWLQTEEEHLDDYWYIRYYEEVAVGKVKENKSLIIKRYTFII